jgi:hypothetical protein
MAKLVAVCRTDDYQYERRQLPLTVDDNLKVRLVFGRHICYPVAKRLLQFSKFCELHTYPFE